MGETTWFSEEGVGEAAGFGDGTVRVTGGSGRTEEGTGG
jgi:hypothetical protein